MNEYFLATSLLIVLALIEGFNGTNFAFRAKHTFRTFKLSYDDGPGIVIQEFGVYSLRLATAYLLAAWEPAWRGGMVIAGIAINVFAGAMHFLRARGIYFGDAVQSSILRLAIPPTSLPATKKGSPIDCPNRQNTGESYR